MVWGVARIVVRRRGDLSNKTTGQKLVHQEAKKKRKKRKKERKSLKKWWRKGNKIGGFLQGFLQGFGKMQKALDVERYQIIE